MHSRPRYKIGDLFIRRGEVYKVTIVDSHRRIYFVVEVWSAHTHNVSFAEYTCDFDWVHKNSNLISQEELFLKKMEY